MASVTLDDPVVFATMVGSKAAKVKKVKLTPDWENAEAILSRRPYRMLLFGPPGTGKTYSAQHVGLLKGQRVYNTYLSEDIGAYQVLVTPAKFGPVTRPDVTMYTVLGYDGATRLAAS